MPQEFDRRKNPDGSDGVFYNGVWKRVKPDFWERHAGVDTSPSKRVPSVKGENQSLIGQIGESFGQFAKGAVVEPVSEAYKFLAPEVLGGSGELARDPMGTIRDLVGGIPSATGRQGQKTSESWKEGDYLGALGNAAAYAVPLIGPAVAGIVEEGKDTGEWDLATGRLAQLLAFRRGRKLPPVPKPLVRKTLSEARRAKGKLGGWTAALTWVESLIERTLPGKGAFQDIRRGQKKDLSDIADSIVPFRGQSSVESIGQGVRDWITTFESGRKKTGNALYKKFTDMSSGVNGIHADMGDVIHTANVILDDLLDAGKIVTPGIHREAIRELRKVVKSDSPLPVKSLVEARSMMLTSERLYRRGGMSDKKASTFGQLASSLDRAVDKATKRSGRPEAYAAWRKASEYYKKTNEMMSSPLIKNVMDVKKGSEVIPAMIQSSKSLKDVRALWAILPPEGIDAVRASMVRKILDESGKGELSIGTLATKPPGPVRSITDSIGLTDSPKPAPSPAVRDISGSSVRRAMEKIGGEKLEVVLGKDYTDQMIRLYEEAAKVGSDGFDAAPGLIAAGMNATVLSPLLSPFGVRIMTAVPAVALGITLNTLSKVLTKQPQAIGMHRAFLSAVNRRDIKGAVVLGGQLERMLIEESEREPEQSEEVQSENTLSPPLEENVGQNDQQDEALQETAGVQGALSNNRADTMRATSALQLAPEDPTGRRYAPIPGITDEMRQELSSRTDALPARSSSKLVTGRLRDPGEEGRMAPADQKRMVSARKLRTAARNQTRDVEPYSEPTPLINSGILGAGEQGVTGADDAALKHWEDGMSQGFPGMIYEGNIDHRGRPAVDLGGGRTGTILSIGIDVDGTEYLIPRIYDGAVHTEEEATARFYDTGEHLGAFDTVENANAYGSALSDALGRGYFDGPDTN